jgi:predicted CxxxxCH...CXXCH cytochrome family protein
MPGAQVIGGLHGNGRVDVVFDSARVGPEISYDPSAKSCAVTCHDAGGARPRPVWTETTPMTCQDCHQSPPKSHFPGACTGCHQEANAEGTSLSGGPLHLDGHVELGNGNGTCGACHGHGDDPWPTTEPHAAHERSTLTAPFACASCHVVPTTLLDPVHWTGTPNVVFSGLSTARGASPSWDGVSCTNVACHGAKLADVPAVLPVWTDTSGAASQCGACHGIPPSQHTPSTSCDSAACHGGEIFIGASGTPSISASGAVLHINGEIDFAQ